MNLHTHHTGPSGEKSAIKASRSPRFNIPVRHPSKWSLLLECALASPMRLHRYRNLSIRMLEDTIDTIDGGTCE